MKFSNTRLHPLCLALHLYLSYQPCHENISDLPLKLKINFLIKEKEYREFKNLKWEIINFLHLFFLFLCFKFEKSILEDREKKLKFDLHKLSKHH